MKWHQLKFFLEVFFKNMFFWIKYMLISNFLTMQKQIFRKNYDKHWTFASISLYKQ